MAELDRAALEGLLDQVGDPAVVLLIITTFLEGIDERLGNLAAGAADGDHELIARTAHSLKSAAALVGLHHLRWHAQALESDPADPDHLGLVRRGLVASRPALAAARDGFDAQFRAGPG